MRILAQAIGLSSVVAAKRSLLCIMLAVRNLLLTVLLGVVVMIGATILLVVGRVVVGVIGGSRAEGALGGGLRGGREAVEGWLRCGGLLTKGIDRFLNGGILTQTTILLAGDSRLGGYPTISENAA